MVQTAGNFLSTNLLLNLPISSSIKDITQKYSILWSTLDVSCKIKIVKLKIISGLRIIKVIKEAFANRSFRNTESYLDTVEMATTILGPKIKRIFDHKILYLSLKAVILRQNAKWQTILSLFLTQIYQTNFDTLSELYL